jgi:hypothetical protein
MRGSLIAVGAHANLLFLALVTFELTDRHVRPPWTSPGAVGVDGAHFVLASGVRALPGAAGRSSPPATTASPQPVK